MEMCKFQNVFLISYQKKPLLFFYFVILKLDKQEKPQKVSRRVDWLLDNDAEWSGNNML